MYLYYNYIDNVWGFYVDPMRLIDGLPKREKRREERKWTSAHGEVGIERKRAGEWCTCNALQRQKPGIY